MINPETGEQVRPASVEPQEGKRVDMGGVAAAPKPASWGSPPRFRAGTGAARPGTASSAPSPPATKSAEPRAWASTCASTPKCWSTSSRRGDRPPLWVEECQQGGQGPGSLGPPPPPCAPSPRIFGFEGADAEDVIYVNWLNMVRAGLLALEFYTPEASNWRQVGAGGEPSGVGEPEVGDPGYRNGTAMPMRHMNWV